MKKPSAKDSAISDATERKLRNLKPFQPGVSGNPAGRPKGSRNNLSEAFLDALYADFIEHGIEAIQAARAERPSDYLRVIAGIVPKEMHISQTTHMSDEEFLRLSALVRAIEVGAAAAIARAQSQGRLLSSDDVH